MLAGAPGAGVGGASTSGSAGIQASGGGTGGAASAAGAGGSASRVDARAGRSGSDAATDGGSGGSSAGGADGAGATEACPATATATPGETSESIMVDGLLRTYERHIPPGYDGTTPLPVVFDFHGLGGTGAGWKGSTAWAQLADQHGFIAIWPDGIDNSWNAGRCCRGAFEQNIDDVGFVRAMLEALKADACIDEKRVYATGCSNGGAMSFKLACDAADVIAAVAPVDFDCVTNTINSVDEPSCGMCTPARPITEIQFRGTADSLVPYEGGIRPGGMTVHAGAEQTFAEWGGINMCSGDAVPFAYQAGCQTYPTCGGDAETVLCTVQDGTHCGSYQSFGIAQLAWETFERHALP